MHTVLVGRSEGKRPLRRLRCRWEDNIKMDLKKVGYDARNWTLLKIWTNSELRYEQ